MGFLALVSPAFAGGCWWRSKKASKQGRVQLPKPLRQLLQPATSQIPIRSMPRRNSSGYAKRKRVGHEKRREDELQREKSWGRSQRRESRYKGFQEKMRKLQYFTAADQFIQQARSCKGLHAAQRFERSGIDLRRSSRRMMSTKRTKRSRAGTESARAFRIRTRSRPCPRWLFTTSRQISAQRPSLHSPTLTMSPCLSRSFSLVRTRRGKYGRRPHEDFSAWVSTVHTHGSA